MTFEQLRGAALVTVASAFLLACGGGSGGGGGNGDDNDDDSGDSGGSTDTSADASGYLLDSPVAGIGYESGELSGVTNSTGQFRHEPGEPVTFNYAGLTLGPVTLQESGEVVTPIELLETAREDYADDAATVNLLRLLQSLDSDGDLDTGIELGDVSGTDAEDALADIALDGPEFDSGAQDALNAVADATGSGGSTLISAEAAIEHFEETLKQIETEPEQRSEWLVGTWEIRMEEFGALGVTLTLEDDGDGATGSGTLEEYSDCGGSGFSAWIATPGRAASCTPETFDITWTLEDRTLILDAGEFTDTCTIVSGDQHAFSTDCQIAVGDGTANEVQEFVRIDVEEFDERLVAGTYREFDNEGAHAENESPTLEYRTDNTGGYTTADDSGSFDWAVSADGSSLSLEIEGDPETVTQNFQNYFAGAVEIEEGENSLLIPDYAGWGGGERGIHRYSVPQGEYLDSTTASPSDMTGTGEVEIFVGEGNETLRICRPLHVMRTIESGPVFWMACNGTDGGGGEFIYEIWRTES